jgi:hypothetical protein
MVFLAFNDYQFLGFSSIFYLLAGLRAAVFTFSILFIIFIKRVNNYIVYDRIVVVWQALSLFVLIAVNLTRPQDYYMFVVYDIITISMIYIIFRSRFIIQTTQALAFTAVDLTIVLLFKDVPTPALRGIISGYILTNCLGLIAL